MISLYNVVCDVYFLPLQLITRACFVLSLWPQVTAGCGDGTIWNYMFLHEGSNRRPRNPSLKCESCESFSILKLVFLFVVFFRSKQKISKDHSAGLLQFFHGIHPEPTKPLSPLFQLDISQDWMLTRVNAQHCWQPNRGRFRYSGSEKEKCVICQEAGLRTKGENINLMASIRFDDRTSGMSNYCCLLCLYRYPFFCIPIVHVW